MSNNKSIEMANEIAQWIEGKKGEEIKILNIGELSTLTDYFVLANGSSTTQVKAIADFVDEKAREKGYDLLRREGYQNGRWILLDFNEVIVHIFHEEDREFY